MYRLQHRMSTPGGLVCERTASIEDGIDMSCSFDADTNVILLG